MSKFELVVQQDLSILVHEQGSRYAEIRSALQRFASLIKHPAGVHTFQITALTLWNAAAYGLKDTDVIEILDRYASWPIPLRAKQDISLWMNRYGLFTLSGGDEELTLRLTCRDNTLLERMMNDTETGSLFSGRIEQGVAIVPAKHRGRLKRVLARIGYPVIDKVGYHDGDKLSFSLIGAEEDGLTLLRSYQSEAVEAYIGGKDKLGGDGVILLPCGAGKTVVGIGAMAALQSETLILTSNTTSVQQWKRELIAKTTIKPEQIGEYTSARKQIRPVTITTYQMMTYRRTEGEEWSHMRLFHERDWGLIIYDEVHLLPAPIFRTTADLQATRRLGLTATLVREDGCERDVFSLIGPKRFELPWRQLEEQGWIATVLCTEVRVAMSEPTMERYRRAVLREKTRIAGENEDKISMTRQILAAHPDVPTLVIGQYLDQLEELSQALHAPLLTGKTPQDERQRLYEQFKNGSVPVLVVSKVANFAVDLPDATLAIQVSGSYGSRQEEAQRLGRLLRPKADGRMAHFYTLVSEDTKETEYAMKRQLFLIEQGYEYRLIKEWENGEYGTANSKSS
ncbi:DNA repair helicase XPB [Paenibacillus marinisediminis]